MTAGLNYSARYESGGSSYRGVAALLRSNDLIVGRDEITVAAVFLEA